MYYEMSTKQGWVCPKCGRVYAPFTPMCLYCGGEESVSIPTTTGTPPEWGDRSWAFKGGANENPEHK